MLAARMLDDGERGARVSLPVLNDVARRPAPPSSPERLWTLRIDEDDEEVLRALGRVLDALRRYRIGGAPRVIPLAPYPEPVRARLLRALGEGEVSIEVAPGNGEATGAGAPGSLVIRETALPGLWRVGGRALEVADVPAAVRAADRDPSRAHLSAAAMPESAEAVTPFVEVLARHAAAYRPGAPNHVFALAPLCFDELDLRHLALRLGRGPVLAEARGLGSCRVALTAHRHLWRVQHRNGLGEVIVDNVEVGDVPAAIAAAGEDIADSAERLEAILEG